MEKEARATSPALSFEQATELARVKFPSGSQLIDAHNALPELIAEICELRIKIAGIEVEAAQIRESQKSFVRGITRLLERIGEKP